MQPKRGGSETGDAVWPAAATIVGERGSELTMHERLVAIAAFLPILTAPDFEFGHWDGVDKNPSGVIIMPWFRFSPKAEELLQTCYRTGWVQAFHWSSWAQTPEAQSLRDDPEALKMATPEQLSRLLTTVIRNDRFCEGALESAFETGLLVGILRRASVLAAEHSDGEAA